MSSQNASSSVWQRWAWVPPVLALMAFATPAAAAEQPVLRVGSELDFRPYCFTGKDGQPAGFAVDLIRAVAGSMGLRVRITSGPWDEVWNGLVAGNFDVLPIVARTPGREPLVDFSLPHTETFDAFFRRVGQPEVPNLAAAAGMEIVVMRSDAAHHELLERKFPGKVIPVESIPDGLRLVASGHHDAFLCSKLVGVLECREAGIRGITAGPPIHDYKRVFSFAVRKGDADLLEKLNEGLRIVKASGQYDQIYRKWLGVAAEPPPGWARYLAVALATAFALALAALVWLMWRHAAVWDERLLRTFTPRRLRSLPPIWRYGLAVLIAVAATAIHWALAPWTGMGAPYDVAIFAAIVTALLLGTGPGLLSVFLCDAGIEVFVVGSLPTMLEGATLLRLGISVTAGVGIVGIFHALRVAELKARRSQERLGTFAAATFEGIVESERGQIVDCNEQFAQMTGRPVAELKGAAIADLIAPEDRERVMASIGANREAVLEHSVVRTDGARIVVEAHGRPAAPGSSRRYTAVRDITARKRAEEAIRRIAQFPEENPNPVLRVAADGALMYANAPARALLGACGAAADSSPPEPLAALATEAAQQGRVIERELPVPDGRTFWWGATRPAGEDYVNLYARDITKRKRAEERLRVQIEHMPIACILHDTEFRFTGWNPAAEEIFGFSAAEAIGKHPCDLIVPPQARTHVRQVLARLGTGEAEVESLNENLTKDGRTILCRWTNTPVRDAAGRIVGCLSMAEDVTETIRSRQALLQSREDMDRAQAVAHMGSWRLDVQTNVLFWSEEAWRIFGLPKGTPLTYETFLGTVHTDDRAYVHEKWSAGLRGEPYDIEHRIIVGDAVKWVREKAYLEFDPDGTLRGGFGIVQDITARKAMEDELRRAHDELEMRVRERTAELLETVRQLEAEQAVTERAKALAEVTAHLLRLFTEKTSQKERL